MPEQKVSTVASNSGDVVLAREAQEDPSVPIGHTGAWEGWKLRHPPFASVDANGTLLLLGEQEGPAVLTVAQLAGGAMGAVDQDAEWFGLATWWAAHDLNQHPRFLELVRWDELEVLGRDCGPLGKPALQPIRIEPLGRARASGDQPAGRVDVPVQLGLSFCNPEGIDLFG